jgi:hypothetical protein
MVIYEYKTTIEYDAMSRIVSWSQWNTSLYPEKAIFEINQAPTAEMNNIGALFDEDGLPQFVLFSDGHIEKQKVHENVKKTIYRVMKARFDKDYGKDQKPDVLWILAEESASTNPVVVEFNRRKKEVDDLKK